MSDQKNLVLLVVVLSTLVVLVCCIAPGALFLFNYGGARDRVQVLLVSAVPTTPTPRLTATPRGPTPTATRPGPSPTPTKPRPTATLEAGWKLHPMPKDGFAIAYPSTWTFQDIDPATISSVIATLKKNNPQMASLLESQQGQSATAGVKYVAMDSGANSTANGLLTNSNLIHTNVDIAYTLDVAVESSVKEMEQMAMVSKPIAHRRMQFPAGEAEEIRYTLSMVNASKQTIKVSTTQYLFLNGREVYMLTFSTAPSLETKNLPIFEKIAKTFRFTGY